MSSVLHKIYLNTGAKDFYCENFSSLQGKNLEIIKYQL